MNRFLVGLAAVTVAAAAISCAGERVPQPHGIVIVTLDTTRADRLPAYGASGIATPALDRLAREGVVFERAESVAPLTLTAHSSLFTGLYPPHHGVRDNADRPLDATHRTLAEILRARGFRTGAFVGSTVLARGRGLDRGFDVYMDGGAPGVPTPRRRPGNAVVDEAVAWLDQRGSAPFFLWVHLYDAHAPQTPPIDYRRASGGDSYTAAIAFADAQIGRLLEALDRQRAIETTAVIVAADHGESLGDHGELEHGIFLYESVLHVPLIVRAPGLAPRRVADPASLVDVVPTVLDFLGMAPVAVDGSSLVPAIRGARLPERAVYAESMYARRFGWSPLRMLRDERFKFIDAPRPELYDLDRDPFEEHDLSAERPALVTAMRAGLRTIVRREAARASGAGAPTESPDVSALAALGYVSGTSPAPTARARDPKDYIEVYNDVSRRRAPR